MSAVTSFGNIVNALRSVRDDYNEHLKSVPQYEAFLLFEGSTRKVADTLQGISTSVQPSSMAGEVIAALATAKARFREHLVSVPEYRALMAIDKLISDVSADLGVTSEIRVTHPVEAERLTTDQVSSDATAVSESVVPDSIASETSSAERLPTQSEATGQPSIHEVLEAVAAADLITGPSVEERVGIDIIGMEQIEEASPATSAFEVTGHAPASSAGDAQATVAERAPVHSPEQAEPALTEESIALVPEAKAIFESAAEKAA